MVLIPRRGACRTIMSATGRANICAGTHLDGGSRAPDSPRGVFCEQREGTCCRGSPEDFGSAEGATSDGACNRRRHDGAQVVRANHTDKNSAERFPSREGGWKKMNRTGLGLAGPCLHHLGFVAHLMPSITGPMAIFGFETWTPLRPTG